MKTVIVFFLLCTSLVAIDPGLELGDYVQDNWQTRNGLVDNMVNQVIQTADGYLWLATSYGLVRFDGVSFLVFNKDNGAPLPSNVVTCVYENKDGGMWIGTDKGLAMIKKGKISGGFNFPIPIDMIFKIYQGSNGKLWIGTNGNGVFLLRGDRQTHFNQKNGLSNNFVRSIIEDRTGRLWIGTRKGLNLYKDGKFEILTEKDGLPHGFIRAVFEDSKGRIWIATYGGGICRLEENTGDNKKKFKFIVYDETNGLANNFARTIYEDSRGVLWIGTREGLTRYKDGVFSSILMVKNTPHNLVNSIYEDNEKNLWVGTETQGLFRLKDSVLRSYALDDGLADSTTWCLYNDSRNILWIGMRDGLFHYKDGKFSPFVTEDDSFSYGINSVGEDPQGNLWIGTENKGLKLLKLKDDGRYSVTTYTGKMGLGSDTVRCVVADKNGTVWLGTYDSGMVRYRDGKFTNYTTGNGLCNNNVKSLCLDGNGTLWIGTENGLNSFKDGKFIDYSHLLGRSGDNICVIYEDKEYEERINKSRDSRDGGAHIEAPGRVVLWLGTHENGLLRYEDGHFTRYTTKQGFYSGGVFQVLEDDAGHLWFGHRNGIASARKNELEELNHQLRNANITKDKFYSIIAHDLRNPLHLLLFSSELLGTRYEEQGQIDENTIRQYIGKVLKAAGNMSQLLENLLQWSRSQSGSLECHPQEIDVKRLLEETITYFSDYAEKKHIDLRIDVKPNTRANADEDMIKCVSRNLVHNAVKFTNPGGTVSVSAGEKDDNIVISVSDTGKGIPEKKIPTLFNIGECKPASGTAREKGSGLGLPLCREFVEKNKGKISVTSRPGLGSVFEFSLPKP